MGETKKAIKQEIKSIYKNVLDQLDEEQKKLTSNEKNELREYIEKLSDGTSHSYSYIFIEKKIHQILKKRDTSTNEEKTDIEELAEDQEWPTTLFNLQSEVENQTDENLSLEWKPWAIFNPDGDLIEWYNERVAYYAERINEIITLYRAEEDDRIVGGCIKNLDYILGSKEKPSQRID